MRVYTWFHSVWLYVELKSRAEVKIKYLPSVLNTGADDEYQRSVTGYSFFVAMLYTYITLISFSALFVYVSHLLSGE